MNTILQQEETIIKSSFTHIQNLINIKQMKDQKRAEKRRQAEEEKRAEENRKRTQQEQSKQTYYKNKTEEELRDALSLYMMAIPFTLDELRSKRRKLLKAFHPDNDEGNGGSETIRINNAFDLLQKYTND